MGNKYVIYSKNSYYMRICYTELHWCAQNIPWPRTKCRKL